MNSKLKITLMIFLGTALLAGAAYLAMLYIFPGSTIARSLGLPAAGGKPSVRIEVRRASELPSNDPDADGAITLKQDNSLTISQSSNGQQNGGQSVEVVVWHDTRIYRDATLDNLSKDEIIRGGSRTLSMIVQPMQIEDIAVGDIVQAWGEKRGARLIATDLLIMKNLSGNGQ